MEKMDFVKLKIVGTRITTEFPSNFRSADGKREGESGEHHIASRQAMEERWKNNKKRTCTERDEMRRSRDIIVQ